MKIKLFFVEHITSLDIESFNNYLLGILKEFSENSNEDLVLKRLAFLLRNRHSGLHALVEVDSKFPLEYLEDNSSEVFTLDSVSYISDSCRTRMVKFKSSPIALRVHLILLTL